MERVVAPQPTVVQPGDGEYGELEGVGVVFKLFGEQTNGSVSIVEHPFAVGAFVEPHVHTREDECSIVTEGEIGFRSGDREVVLSAGGYITKPRGEARMMWNAGRTPARMIEVISPAGLEHFFWSVRQLAPEGTPTSRHSRASQPSMGSRSRCRRGPLMSSRATTCRPRRLEADRCRSAFPQGHARAKNLFTPPAGLKQMLMTRTSPSSVPASRVMSSTSDVRITAG